MGAICFGKVKSLVSQIVQAFLHESKQLCKAS